MNEDWKKDRIESCKNGTNPTYITQLKSGYVVIGDSQFLPGYCVLLYKNKVNQLNDLNIDERIQFLKDMTIVGDAINKIYKPKRINYEVLGNQDEYIHAHIFPRYAWEGDKVKKSIRRYTMEEFNIESKQFLNLKDKDIIIKNLKIEIDKQKNK